MPCHVRIGSMSLCSCAYSLALGLPQAVGEAIMKLPCTVDTVEEAQAVAKALHRVGVPSPVVAAGSCAAYESVSVTALTLT